MGTILQRSGIADEAYDVLYRFLGPLRGSLAVSTILISTLFAATTGIIGASVTAMGLIALPSMLKRGYNKPLAAGTICAGGTLGILIPPSIMLIIWGVSAQVSVAKMFIGAILPGILLSMLYIIFILVYSYLRPEVAPAVSREETSRYSRSEILVKFLKTFVPFILIIVGVLGGIFFGVVSPTEAGGPGSLFAIILTPVYRSFSFKMLKEASPQTVQITSMIIYIFIGAKIFSRAFQTIGFGDVFTQFILSGDDMHFTSHYHMDPLLIGEYVCIFLQTSFISPPFAYAIFYLKGVAGEELSTRDIYYKGVIPFLVLQLIGFSICLLFPEIIMWPVSQMKL